ncbi:MAG: phosphate ABC transporter permease subunit PstC [Clostridia bacterium]|nr:phosphate ABC transporter permease subunit PstC [Clostridia bacterium]
MDIATNESCVKTELQSARRYSRVKFYDRLTRYLFLTCAILMTVIIVSIVIFVGKQGIKTFNDVSLIEFFTSTQWQPDTGKFGALTFIFGTFALTGVTILIGAPLGLAGAVFMAKIAPNWLREILKPAIELFVGIPSVVYGVVGLTVVVPMIGEYLEPPGYGLLAAAIVLAIMILPTVISVSEDAIRTLPGALEEASYALGATRWQTISRILVPAAMPGIITAIILGMARAIGETMAVLMVVGNSPQFATSLNMATSVLTTQIILEMGHTPFGSAWNNALFLMAFVLLIITLFLILVVRFAGRKGGMAQ